MTVQTSATEYFHSGSIRALWQQGRYWTKETLRIHGKTSLPGAFPAPFSIQSVPINPVSRLFFLTHLLASRDYIADYTGMAA